MRSYEGLYHNNADPYIREEQTLALARSREETALEPDVPHTQTYRPYADEIVPDAPAESSSAVPRTQTYRPYGDEIVPATVEESAATDPPRTQTYRPYGTNAVPATTAESSSTAQTYRPYSDEIVPATADAGTSTIPPHSYVPYGTSTPAPAHASPAVDPGQGYWASPSWTTAPNAHHQGRDTLSSLLDPHAMASATYTRIDRDLGDCKDKIEEISAFISRVRSQLNALARNANARHLNLGKTGDDELSVMYDEFDIPILNFPRTPADLERLAINEVDAIICALGTQMAHVKGDHHQALRLLVGI